MSYDLVYSFWHFTVSERHEILSSLNLIDDSNISLSEQQKVRLAFQKAKELGVTDQLKDKIREKIKEVESK